ncbi:MAG: DUF2284 domain-containing protein [Eggerthellaceae bacterium]|nr:DUF2284 domain-containing protein [Eggerthellaceae bacterium]
MDVEKLVRECGFECMGTCAASDLVVKPEVRVMCASDKCHSFNRNWSCPPACGTLEEYRDIIAGMGTCYVIQTVCQMRDSFDVDVMLDAAELQSERLTRLHKLLRAEPDGDQVFLLGSGACTLCSECSYPDEPCRFPDLRLVSMEAAGLVVSEVCVSAGIPYNHGQNSIAYTGCVLVP